MCSSGPVPPRWCHSKIRNDAVGRLSVWNVNNWSQTGYLLQLHETSGEKQVDSAKATRAFTVFICVRFCWELWYFSFMEMSVHLALQI